MLIVPDVEEAVAWYVQALGGRLRHTLPADPPYEWASVYLGDVEVMFAAGEPVRQWYSHAVLVSEAPSNLVLYLYVSDALGLHERVRQSARVIMEPVDQPYGVREFAVQDPFGYVLVFAEDLTG